MANLVDDILFSIFDNSYWMAGSSRNPFELYRRNLRAASLVCQSWRQVSQQILFTTVQSNRDFHTKYFSPEITKRDLLLLSHIHNLDIATKCDARDDILRIFQRCPNLKIIWLDWTNVKQITKGQAQDLHQYASAHPLALTKLYIRTAVAYDSHKPSDSAAFYRFISTFSTLTTLRLSTGLAIGAVPLHCRPLTFDSCLNELELEELVSPTHLEWLLASSSETLSQLHFRVEIADDRHQWVASPIERTCGNSIRVLEFAVAFNRQSANVVAACPNLVELVVEVTDNKVPIPIPPVPGTLRHLTIIHNKLGFFRRPLGFQAYLLADDNCHFHLASLLLMGDWELHLRLVGELQILQDRCAKRQIQLGIGNYFSPNFHYSYERLMPTPSRAAPLPSWRN
ncbi:hypothetical protein FA13DRAFT_1784902 [Coprinellus micaceus]|uniref:F-box domain-containing protein n=1 Tax=Coprinellus micaceus TaxID=71717 RepID=A0A4Y7TY97_COPMI|nr:hypothetical protein FA13DRAFT_1784902 [Coprinellus micaceus]